MLVLEESMKRGLSFALLAVAAFSGRPLRADEPKPPAATPAPTAAPAARAADVQSLDAILAAVYDVISGPAGKRRDWERMKSLFVDGARLVPTGGRPKGDVSLRVLDVNGYIERSAPFLEKDGFFEREIARRVETFGHIAHVFSTYESRHEPGAAPFARGINSFQLMFDGKRWWVVTIFWEGETESNRIPEKYLKNG